MIVVDSNIKAIMNSKPAQKIYKYARADWENARKDTGKFTCEHLPNLDQRSVEDNWKLLKSHITDTLATHVASKYIRGKHHLPWLSRDLKKILKRKNKLYFKARITQSNDDWRKYKKLKRIAQKQMRKPEWDYVNNILQESLAKKDTKCFWRHVKSKRQDSMGCPLYERKEYYRVTAHRRRRS